MIDAMEEMAITLILRLIKSSFKNEQKRQALKSVLQKIYTAIQALYPEFSNDVDLLGIIKSNVSTMRDKYHE